MGLMQRLIGGAEAARTLGAAAGRVAEVFVPNATERQRLSASAQRAALNQHGEEFQHGRIGRFDRVVNGLNRLPRPFLAFGTLGLFVFAMVDPPRFADRMVGLNEVPEPLWWLLGAIVSFYFGARELHYFRAPASRQPAGEAPEQPPPRNINLAEAAGAQPNAALHDWRARAAAADARTGVDAEDSDSR